MLHLRVIAPEDMRDSIIDVLRSEVGVANILLYPGAALDPVGDEITADIARECANSVIKKLKHIDVQHRGAITLEVLDTVLSSRAHKAEDEAEGDPADALVWDELIARTREESTLSVTFLLFLTLACLLAAVGVVTDSTVTVVGAMVVGPEFGPLAALSVALVRRRLDLARRASLALLIGFPLAMVITALGTLGAQAVGWLSLDSVKQLSEVDFIFHVGPLSLVVALLAGAAGMLSLVSAKSAALVGVFISVTTVPAAGFSVVAAILGDWDVAAKSALQLAVNLVGIVIAGVLVLVLRLKGALIRAWPRPETARQASHAAMRALLPCDGILRWASRWRWSIAPATRSIGWWRCIRTSSGCARRHTRARRSRPTRCTVEPADHFVNWQQDAFGNFLARLVFPDRARSLTITVGLIADLKVINPFDFFIEEYAEQIGFTYPKALAEDLKPYLRPVDEAGEGSGPGDLAQAVGAATSPSRRAPAPSTSSSRSTAP